MFLFCITAKRPTEHIDADCTYFTAVVLPRPLDAHRAHAATTFLLTAKQANYVRQGSRNKQAPTKVTPFHMHAFIHNTHTWC